MYKILKGDERKNINQNMTEYEDYGQLSHLLPRSDLIASLLVQYDTNPWNLFVFNVTFILFVEYVQLYFYSKLKESLKSFYQRHARSKWNINVAIQFYRWIKVYFRLFKTHYHTLDYHTPKQR